VNFTLALLAIPFLLYVVRNITNPDEVDDYTRCRGLDKVED